MSTPEKAWDGPDLRWLNEFGANVIAAHELGTVPELVRTKLDELLICMEVYAERGQAERLTDRKGVGTSDWFGFRMPWPSLWHDDEARLTLYKRNRDATYELRYERFEVDPVSGEELVEEDQTLAIGYPARGEVDGNARRHMAAPHIAPLPPAPNVQPRPSQLELWQRADSILSVD